MHINVKHEVYKPEPNNTSMLINVIMPNRNTYLCAVTTFPVKSLAGLIPV